MYMYSYEWNGIWKWCYSRSVCDVELWSISSYITSELDFVDCAVSNDDPEEEEPSKEGE